MANIWNPGTRTPSPSVRHHNTMQMRWFGGNISGAGPYYVHCTGTNHWVNFIGTTFYSDFGPPADAVFNNEGTLSALNVSECLEGASAVFMGSPGAVFNNITFQGDPAGSGAQKIFNAPGASLSNSMIHCSGLGLTLGQIAGSNILLNPGPISAQVDNSHKFQ